MRRRDTDHRSGLSGRRTERRTERLAETRTGRLDVPREARRPFLRRPEADSDRFGRFAERFARFMGTARFLLYMTLFVIMWLAWNWMAPGTLPFDDYPFIFLTLMLSMQASYAAPLILLAQNRQEDRDRVIGEQDRQANTRAHADMEFLAREMASLRMALSEVATRDYVRSELRSLLSDIEEREGRDRGQRDSGQPGPADRPGDRTDGP